MKPMHTLYTPQILGHEYQENEVFQNLLTIQQRRVIYDEKIRRLMKIGRIQEKDMKTFITDFKKMYICWFSTEYDDDQTIDYDQFILPAEEGD